MNLKKPYLDIIALAGIILFFLLLVLRLGLTNYPFIFNFDEVNGLIIPYLKEKGYKLYEQIWYDHLPGFPWLLSLWFNLTDDTLPMGRAFMIILSVSTFSLFYGLLRLSCSILPAIIATLMLITSFEYLPLTVIIKNDLPSIGFLLLSFLLFFTALKRTNSQGQYLFYFLSALTFVFSLELKLSALTAIPSFLGLLFLNHQGMLPVKVKSSLVWLVSLAVSFAFLSLTFLNFSYTHIIGSHTKANKVFSATGEGGSIFSLIYQSGLSYEPIYIIATLAVIIYLLIKREQINWAIAPLLWLFFNLLRFATISPVWPTYYVYLIFPAAWLVGLFLENFLNPQALSQVSKNLNPVTLIGLSTALLLLLQAAFNSVRIAAPRHPTLTQFRGWVKKNTTPHPVEKILAFYQDSNKTIITDHAYYTHKFGLNTLPEMAIISRKRLDAEGIDGQDILEAIQKSKADLVFLYRFHEQFLQSPALTQYLRDNFVEYSFKQGKGKLYVAKGLEKPSSPSQQQ